MELEMINLSKHFGKKEAVKGVTARLTPGVWGLLGADLEASEKDYPE